MSDEASELNLRTRRYELLRSQGTGTQLVEHYHSVEPASLELDGHYPIRATPIFGDKEVVTASLILQGSPGLVKVQQDAGAGRILEINSTTRFPNAPARQATLVDRFSQRLDDSRQD